MCAAAEQPILNRLEIAAEVLEKELSLFVCDFEDEVERLDELIDGANIKPANQKETSDGEGKPVPPRFRALEARLNRVKGLKDKANSVLVKLRRNIDQLRGGQSTETSGDQQ